MKNSEPMPGIATVEREVGLSKDVLRVWERRYGFPAPLRDHHGERVYPADQVERLRLVKRLMDQGHRPGRLLACPLPELHALASAPASARASGPAEPAVPDGADAVLAALRAHDTEGLSRLMQQQLALRGLASFVQDIVAPLTTLVGEEWARGSLQVFEEHLFTETVARLLRQALALLPAGRAPTVLLTTAPDEQHGLGLLMVECLLALHGARCISLGTGTPVAAIAGAAEGYGAQVVALSFSSAFPARSLPAFLRQLRERLPSTVEVWAGGAAVHRLADVDGVQRLKGLDEAVDAMQAWQARHGVSPVSE